jgi:hypothetical protein
MLSIVFALILNIFSFILDILSILGGPICSGALLLALAGAGILAWRWRRTSPRRCVGLAALTVLFVAGAAFCWPKPAGRYCAWQCDPWGKERYFDCECVGLKWPPGALGSDGTFAVCFGIPVNCDELEVYADIGAIEVVSPSSTSVRTKAK